MSVPPLRERPDDIPLLVQHFVRQFRGDRTLQVTREDLERLRRHGWPGNVRELRNVIERACALATAIAWRSTMRSTTGPARRRRGPRAGAVDVDLPFKEAKARSSRASSASTSRTLLKRHKRNLSAAARGADRSQAPARADAQARAARVGRLVTMSAARLARRAARARRAPGPRDLGRRVGRRRRLRARGGLPAPAAARQPRRARAATLRRARSRAATPPGATPGQPPVLLIHGYLATRGSLHLLERHLTSAGLIVMSYPLGGPINLGDIRDSAGLIARKVESIVAQTGHRARRHRRPFDGRPGRPRLPQAAGRPAPRAPAGDAGDARAGDLVGAVRAGDRAAGAGQPAATSRKPVPARAGGAAAAGGRRRRVDRGGPRLAGARSPAPCSTGSGTSPCRRDTPGCWSTRRWPRWSSTSSARPRAWLTRPKRHLKIVKF